MIERYLPERRRHLFPIRHLPLQHFHKRHFICNLCQSAIASTRLLTRESLLFRRHKLSLLTLLSIFPSSSFIPIPLLQLSRLNLTPTPSRQKRSIPRTEIPHHGPYQRGIQLQHPRSSYRQDAGLSALRLEPLIPQPGSSATVPHTAPGICKLWARVCCFLLDCC